MALEHCQDLKINNATPRHTRSLSTRWIAIEKLFSLRLGQQFQALAEEVAGRFWQDGDWVLMGFDGSRVTTPRTVSNEREFCAPNYGKGQ